jgi:SAM-dependent methyltransferase
VESLDLAGERYDHILILRSYNHLEDPASVIRQLVAALRPGGSLLVVDNVAFALVRSLEQTRRGEQGRGAFEHYHNHSADEAHSLIQLDELDLSHSSEVAPSTSNQWFLHYEKAVAAPRVEAAR